MTFFQRRSIVSWSLINIIIIFVIIVFIKFCKIYGNETKWTGTVVPVFRIIIWPCVYLRVSSIIFSHYPNYDLNGRYFLSSSFMILETNMLGYIYTFFFILFQQLLHTSSLERSLFFMYYLLDGRQLKAFMCNTHVFNLQRFERERVYTGNEFFNESMDLSAVNLHDWRPSSISTPKISHVTENGQWLGVNKKGNHTTHIGSFESK